MGGVLGGLVGYVGTKFGVLKCGCAVGMHGEYFDMATGVIC